MALISSNFASILDVRFRKIWDERFTEIPDQLDRFYFMDGGSKPGRQSERYSTVGTLGLPTQFTGTVNYSDVYPGYDVTLTPLEFAQGIQVERRLFDDDQFSVIDQKPKALAGAMYRLRQTHGARIFNNAFSNDTFFATNSESVALCSTAHTTAVPGVSTSSGFDNSNTTALSAVSVATARNDMVNFRGDQAERISVVPDTLLVPPQLYDTAFEIVGSQGKPDTANNNANVHYGQYEVYEWVYLTDSNDWFMMDSRMMKDFGLIWLDRIKGEFGFVEDFDTLMGKWRAYARWGSAWLDWRFILGNQVS